MAKETKIKYDPSLSIKENAEKNGVTVDAIRYYIRTRGIDRRYEEKAKVLEELKNYIKQNPNSTKADVARGTGRGINTVVRYWDILQGKAELLPSTHKSDIREHRITSINNRYVTYLDKLPIEFLREYLEGRISLDEKIDFDNKSLFTTETKTFIQPRNSKRKSGYVYIITNPSFKSNIFKVGNSENYIERIKSLDSTSTPTPFEMAAVIKVDNCNEVESFFHELLSVYAKRLRTNREFFEGDVEKAKNLLHSIVTKIFYDTGEIII